MKTLFPHQEAGIAALSCEPRFLLADDMGLGKTLQAIRAAKARPDVPGCRLIICPASARAVWSRELIAEGIDPVRLDKGADIRNLPMPRADHPGWYIVSLPIYRENFAEVARRLWPIGILIHDEAHQVKDIDSKSNRTLTPLALRVPIYWAMTGTPIKNDYSEFFSLARLIIPHKMLERHGIANFYGWRETFCVLQTESIRVFDHKTRQVITRQIQKIAGSKNPGLLKQIMQPYMLRRKKAQVLPDLPALRWQPLYVEAKGLPRLYSTELAEAAEAAEKGRQPRSQHIMAARADLAMRLAPAARDIILDHVDGSADPIIVFCSHLDPLHLLKAILEGKGLRVALLTGETPIKNRAMIESDFQAGKLDVLLGQTLAAGTAITLTKANRVLFIDLAWSPADNAQARDRAHRIGQRQEVLAQYLVSDDPLSERVTAILARKTAEITELENVA